jgi:hypothetical protein
VFASGGSLLLGPYQDLQKILLPIEVELVYDDSDESGEALTKLVWSEAAEEAELGKGSEGLLFLEALRLGQLALGLPALAARSCAHNGR